VLKDAGARDEKASAAAKAIPNHRGEPFGLIQLRGAGFATWVPLRTITECKNLNNRRWCEH